jgi:hypothetical protein
VTVTAPAYTEKTYALASSADLIDLTITGHARIADGLVDETALGSRTFCLRADGCKCPDGSSPENAQTLRGDGALLALTGGPEGAQGTVRGRDLDCTAKDASWLFDSPSRYSGGPSHTVVTAYTCAGLRGPWQATMHVTHSPATAGDPPLDRLVKFSWTFGRDGLASPTIGPYEDTVYGSAHTLIYYPVIELNESAGTITVVSLQGSEDGSERIDVAYQLDRIGEAVPVKPGKPEKC